MKGGGYGILLLFPHDTTRFIFHCGTAVLLHSDVDKIQEHPST